LAASNPSSDKNDQKSTKEDSAFSLLSALKGLGNRLDALLKPLLLKLQKILQKHPKRVMLFGATLILLTLLSLFFWTKGPNDKTAKSRLPNGAEKNEAGKNGVGKSESAANTPQVKVARKEISSNFQNSNNSEEGITGDAPLKALQPQQSNQASAPIGFLLPKHRMIEDQRVIEALIKGREMRNAGDTRKALAYFRKADILLPGHPALLYEMAKTYESIGLKDKAGLRWKEIIKMGENEAGDYYALADIRLNEQSITSKEEVVEKGVQLQFGTISSNRKNLGSREQIQLSVPIRKIAGKRIDPTQVMVYVFFFELVNGSEVRQSETALSRESWKSMPIDWNSEEYEMLDIAYQLPEGSALEEIRQGSREYYGYILKLFYDNEIQDVITQPRTIYERLSGDSRNQLDDSLFDFN